MDNLREALAAPVWAVVRAAFGDHDPPSTRLAAPLLVEVGRSRR